MTKIKKIFLIFLAATALFPLCVTACGCGGGSESGGISGADGTDDTETVYYYDFGAKGDGETDDFEAIKATHEYANEHGCNVKADSGDRFYIGAHNDTIAIKTNTDWTDAEFIIDDSVVTVQNRGWNVFEVQPDTKSYKVTVPSGYSLKQGQENLGMDFDTPVLLCIVNNKKKDYIRYGKNTNSGSDRQEMILVDADGAVDESTPILWDYDTVTGMTAYPVSDRAITIRGGTFTTIANTAEISANYYARGINVKRSNTTLSGITHYVTGEGSHGSPYTGFYAVNYANHVTIENCVLSGHKTYTNIKPTGAVSQGTYDTQAVRSNDVTWIGCTQANAITDTTYWGVMASNFCKNLKMRNCNLSRFDAHQGVYNATITDTELGQNLSIVGAGTLYLENVTRSQGSHFVQLRTDYGSTWQGDIVFKNCTLKSTGNSCCAILAEWNNWDFGYQCYLPTTVTLDNFKVDGASGAYVFSAVTSASAQEVAKSKNPLSVTQAVYVLNESTGIRLSANTTGLFDGTKIDRQSAPTD